MQIGFVCLGNEMWFHYINEKTVDCAFSGLSRVTGTGNWIDGKAETSKEKLKTQEWFFSPSAEELQRCRLSDLELDYFVRVLLSRISFWIRMSRSDLQDRDWGWCWHFFHWSGISNFECGPNSDFFFFRQSKICGRTRRACNGTPANLWIKCPVWK